VSGQAHCSVKNKVFNQPSRGKRMSEMAMVVQATTEQLVNGNVEVID